MKTVRCPQCNLVCWNTVLSCGRCGFDVQSIAVTEPPAESEIRQSFEQNGFGHSAQNSDSFYAENTQTGESAVSENQNSYQSNNRNNFHENSRNGQNYNRHQENQHGNNFQNRNQYTPNNLKTKKGLAVASLVCGIVGFPPVGLILGGLLAAVLGSIFGGVGFVIGFGAAILIPIYALIAGIVAVRRTNKHPQEFGGKGLAIAGICLGGFVVLFFPIIGAIAIPNLLAARNAANEGSAISSIRNLADAETALRQSNGTVCADLNVLGKNQLIDEVLAKGEKNGYRFIMSKLPTLQSDCAITATPVSDSTGTRAFYYSTEDGEIRAKKYAGKMADMNDPPLQ